MDFEQERQHMVESQLAARGIDDTAVLQAFFTIPREQFVPPEFQHMAYEDRPLAIPAKQTISQPYVVAYMLAALHCHPTDAVLEVGTGSGYVAALLSQMVAQVITIERHANLVAYAQQRLAQLGCTNVQVIHGDGTLGWPAAAPYHGIIVAAGGPYVPPELKKQLAVNGRLVMPVGRRSSQNLICLQRLDNNTYQKTNLGPVKFVPLIGTAGWERNSS